MTFEAVIWEKAEHWTFIATVQATDATEARRLLCKQYSAKAYSIRSIHVKN